MISICIRSFFDSFPIDQERFLEHFKIILNCSGFSSAVTVKPPGSTIFSIHNSFIMALKSLKYKRFTY